MRALERRRRSEEGREDYDGAHHRFPRLQRVGDDVCALLAVPLGSWALCTASMRGARRLSSQQWIQIAVGEPTTSSYQWSRVVRAALVLSLSKLAWLWASPQPQGGPTLRLLPSLLRRRRVLSAGHAFVCRGLVYGLCCFPFSSSSERRATPSLGSLASFKPSHLSHL